ncbi:hypothetical protein Swol_0742 [Syntrophomonas wolfei subsp. wolfei str. Goettingen G311]|uniref:Uncharacterized protein n=1 Tax=Syntrophomonas wolfei subsp. wolfei (strain DSM 2245B / Goettingen) TaxID=335541 RepID=Q0AYZ0_SYNWW|nr:hypothetical protein Swol_0742 [Syntrophomonas wolfei subsp. wolfei str. Goettingen G311]
MQSLQLASFNDDNEILTKAPLFKHLHCEIKYNNMIFFRIDGEWYQIENQFIEKLEQEFKEIVLENTQHNLLSESWGIDKGEDCYNQKYIGKSSFLVLHKVLLNGMELCDLLKYDGKTAYLIHVKKGFGNNMRDLTLQIDIAARTLKEALAARDYDFFGQLYQRLKMKNATTPYAKKVAGQASIISKESFIKIFMDRDVVFCLAFLDTAKKERNITNGTEFESSIAKYSIVELYKRLRIQNIPLKLIQVKQK